jgi:hypothetical protein
MGSFSSQSALTYKSLSPSFLLSQEPGVTCWEFSLARFDPQKNRTAQAIEGPKLICGYTTRRSQEL